MKKIKFYLLTDSFFIFFALFFTLYAIVKYNGASFFSALLLSSVFSALLTCGYAVYQIIKNDKKTSAYIEKELKKSLSNYLSFTCQKEVLALFLKYYTSLNFDAKIEGDKIVILEQKTCVFPIFTIEKITTKEVINAYKKTKKGYKTKVLYNSATSDVLLLTTNFNMQIELFDINCVYHALKSYNLLPKLEINEKSKIKIKPIIKNLFKKQKAGKFLLFGILSLLFSTITFFPLYYVLVGAILIIISIILRFFAPFENGKNIEI